VEFLATLNRHWLPDASFVLLYRGSRDGLTPAAFHTMCDGKGPTLVLVKAQSPGHPVCVFGGYASTSWKSPPVQNHGYGMPASEYLSAPGSFVFTVVNPFGDGVVRMPLVAGHEQWALHCNAFHGPSFGQYGLSLSAASATSPFSGAVSPHGASSFADPQRRGGAVFTGHNALQVLEIDVWLVI
jgi:hypothetical protein